MTSIALDLAQLLQTSGVGTVGTDIFTGKLPDQDDAPDQAIGVFETGAIRLSPKWKRDDIMVQFLVRGPQRKYEDSYAYAKSVQDALLGIPPVTINSKEYVLFIMIGGINHIQADQRDRHIFSLNFRVVIENAPGGVRLAF